MTKHFLSLEDFKDNEIQDLIERTQEIKSGAKTPFFLPEKPVFIANLFLEASTRTKFSFEIAEKKLGLQILDFQAASSSMVKGESLYDTCRTLEAQGVSAIVLRCKQESEHRNLADKLNISIINAGEGKTEHPTQALLDLFTLSEKWPSFSGKKILILGDVKHSRVVGSLYPLLRRFKVQVYQSGPEHFLRYDIETLNLDEAIQEMDAVYLLRMQKERHLESLGMEEQDYHFHFGLTKDRYAKKKSGSLILHPGPFERGVEIAGDVVEATDSLIFNQKENGVYTRTAILEWIFEEKR